MTLPEMTIQRVPVMPLGVDWGYEALGQVWNTFVSPEQEAQTPPSIEMRLLMAVLRSVATGFEADDEQGSA